MPSSAKRWGPLELKGKSVPVTAHRLLAVHAGAAGVARRLDSPFVGRGRPLAQLLQAFEDVVADRNCHLFTVLGPPSGRGEVPARSGGTRVARRAGDRGARAMPLLRRGDHLLATGRNRARRRRGRPRRPRELDRGAPTRGCVSLGGRDAGRAARRRADGLALPAEEVGWAVRRFLEGLARAKPLVV